MSNQPNTTEVVRVSETEITWRCFFCDFTTSDKDEAAAHFGDRDDPEESKPMCKWWQRMSAEEKVGTLQDTIQQLNYERMENYAQDKEISRQKGLVIEMQANLIAAESLVRDLARGYGVLQALTRSCVACAANSQMIKELVDEALARIPKELKP